MPFGMPIKLLEATARTYRTSVGRGHYDEEDRFLCPSCGMQQDIFPADFDDTGVAIETCLNCEAKVRVTYRRMFRKDF